MWDIRAITLVPSHLQVRKSQKAIPTCEHPPLMRNQQMSSLVLLGSASTLSIKISIFFLYLRIFRINQGLRYWVYSGMIFCIWYTAVYWGLSTAIIMECSAPQNAHGVLCTNIGFISLAIVIINVVTDFYVLALPIGIVIRLNAKRGKRIGLIAIFSCGLV